MKLNIQKNKLSEPSISISMTKRELELFTCLIGTTTPAALAETINRKSLFMEQKRLKPTDVVELDDMIGCRFYTALLQAFSDEELFPNPVIKTVQFVYTKNECDSSWRNLDVTMEDLTYIGGYDLDDDRKFKKFSKSKILGSKIITV